MLYDMPLFRPPSEGDNLIIQATLGCSYNRCSFCSMYRTKRHAERPLDAVRADIDDAARDWPDAHRVFLADGDAFSLPTDHLLALLAHLADRLPDLARVSAYATPASLLRKSPAELDALRAARLSLVYLGVESGHADILRRITKGASPRGLITAMAKARAANIKVSATVILGLAGREFWREHITATAEVIAAAPPAFLSTLQLFLEPDRVADFRDTFARGDHHAFIPQDDPAILDELDLLLDRCRPDRPVIFRSNHASNALALAGNLPRDNDRLRAEIAAVRDGAAGLRPRFLRGL